jgi:hypothetical protein
MFFNLALKNFHYFNNLDADVYHSWPECRKQKKSTFKISRNVIIRVFELQIGNFDIYEDPKLLCSSVIRVSILRTII